MAITAAGLGSNLDVNGLVTQLMAIEKQPLNRLQGQISTFNSNLSQYGRVRSELSALQTAARALGSDSGFNVYSATVSDSSAGSVAASTDAAAGQYSLRVLSLARAQTLVSPNTNGAGTMITDANASISGTATLTITQGSGSFAVSLSGSSLNQVRDAINSASDNTGVLASVINDGSGFRLVLRSEDTGVANAVSSVAVSSASNTNYNFLNFTSGTAYSAGAAVMGESVAAANAQLQVDGVTVTSTTNTFSGAIEGVTFVAKAVTTSNFSLTVTRDDAALVDKAKAFVSAYNNAIAGSELRYAKDGALARDSTVLSIMTGLRNLAGQPGGPSGNALSYLVEAGFSIDKDGVMSLDTSTFGTVLREQPQALRALLADSSDGIFKRFDTSIAGFLSADGLIDSRETGIRSTISGIQERLEQMNVRLASVEARYRREFSTLDSLVARMNQVSATLSRSLR